MAFSQLALVALAAACLLAAGRPPAEGFSCAHGLQFRNNRCVPADGDGDGAEAQSGDDDAPPQYIPPYLFPPSYTTAME
jgi:hypothetical protein